MTFYPVVIPTLNRYEHFKNCVESLAKNTLAGETELIIGLDYPPSEKYREGWKKIKAYIPTITGFKDVVCLERTENFGSGKNSSDLEEYALSKYDAYIYSEDDNIFSPYFLQFINDGLEKYRDDDSVFAVCGYSYPIDWETDKECVLQHQYFSAWGYGIWKNREETISKEFTYDFLKQKILKRNTSYRINTINSLYALNLLYSDDFDFTDVNRSVYLFLSGKNVLMPRKTLVKNIGWDGSGEHCILEKSSFFNEQELDDSNNIPLNDSQSLFSHNLESFQTELHSDQRWNRVKMNLFFMFNKCFSFPISRKIYCVLRKIKKNCTNF